MTITATPEQIPMIVADDALTEFEQSQLNYEGVIRYPSKEVTW